MNRNCYNVSCNSDEWTRNRAGCYVRAESYEHAAAIVARRITGRRAHAERTMGNKGMSGWFRAYVPCDNGFTSRGEAFRIW